MRRFLLGIVCLVGILAGCTDQSNADQTKELKEQVEQLSLERDALLNTVEEKEKALELAINQQINRDYSMILAKEIEKYPQTLYKSATLDIDEDGEEEVIELYVNVEKLESGQFAWDDGQNWLLVVKDGEKTYPLFDDYVQLGSIDFSTTTYDKTPAIVMIMAQHSDRTVQKFTYDKNEKGYQKVTFYKKENINNHYNQEASYAFFKDAFKLMDMAFTTKTLSVLEASEKSLQDSQERRLIIDPILVDIYNAQRLLDMTGDLNRELNISLGGVIDLLHQIVNTPPTAEQMTELILIHNVFKEIGTSDLINKEENRIHPEVTKKLQTIGFYP